MMKDMDNDLLELDGDVPVEIEIIEKECRGKAIDDATFF